MTKSQIKFVVDSYAKYFGRAADADTIKAYGLKENGKAEKVSVILRNIIDDSDYETIGLSTEEFVNNAFQNLFGRNATTKEMNKYSKVVDKNKDLPINSIVKKAGKFDKAVYDNKIAVANKYAELGGKGDLDLSKISKGNLVDLKTVGSLSDLTNSIDKLADNSGIPSSFDGKTFVLTAGVDAGKDFIGTNKDDLFIGDNTVTNKTSSATDTLDGGKGTEDTFKLYAGNPAAAADSNLIAGELPTLKNIENVVLYDFKNGTTAADLDLTKWDSVETLYMVRAGSTVGSADGIKLGEKVTTVNFETTSSTQKVTFDAKLTAATVGVNNVGTAAAAAVTVNGTALKTLTVDASGKASNVTLTIPAAIETLNITGKADLKLGTSSTTIKTVDGSKAEGNLTFSNTTSMTSIKTGSGNDTVTVDAAVASGETIDLGAGNDKLVKSAAGSVATSTTTVIDGGAGIDSLDAALVTSGNAGVFAHFETLSLTATAADLDLALVNKSTFTTIAIDGASNSTVRNVSTSQSLAVNATGTSTTLLFKDVAGTADAYTINFNADNTASTNAGTVVIDKIENVTVNSVGKTGVANTIALNDASAKSLVITGDKALTVTFATAFGSTTAADATNGLGVAAIDASTATGAVNINTTNVNVAFNGLTIKGGTAGDSITLAKKATVDAGAGDDTITTSATGGTLTGGTGNDTFDIGASKLLAAPAPGEFTEATGVVKVTITDLTAGDKIKFAALTGEDFNKIKVNVDGASNLDAALNIALAGNGITNGIINWFQYAGNTYIVEDVNDTVAGAGSTQAQLNDIVVKINGLVNLTNSDYSTVNDTLTIA